MECPDRSLGIDLQPIHDAVEDTPSIIDWYDREAEYRMEFVDEDRFIQELEALVAPAEKAS